MKPSGSAESVFTSPAYGRESMTRSPSSPPGQPGGIALRRAHAVTDKQDDVLGWGPFLVRLRLSGLCRRQHPCCLRSSPDRPPRPWPLRAPPRGVGKSSKLLSRVVLSWNLTRCRTGTAARTPEIGDGVKAKTAWPRHAVLATASVSRSGGHPRGLHPDMLNASGMRSTRASVAGIMLTGPRGVHSSGSGPAETT